MKPLVCLATFVAVAMLCATSGLFREPQAAAGRLDRVSVTRIFTGPDGFTHAEPVDVKFSPGTIPKTWQSSREKMASAYFVNAQPGFVEDWHNASAHRYVFTLSGRAEIELTGGQKIPIDHDKVLLADDLTGKGHTTRVVGNEPWIAVFVQFKE